MTCLYCGKKLGFFSRYKDTPFCSEEHLRAHQDEMERALMERLGSKISAHSGKKDLEAAKPEAPVEDPARAERRDRKKKEEAPGTILGLSDASHFDAPVEASPIRRGAPREFRVMESTPELPPLPVAERPIDKNRLLGRKEADPPPPPPPPVRTEPDSPAPVCEDIFEQEAQPHAALDVTRPMHAPNSFAILIQADFCTPTLPEQKLHAAPRMVEDEVALDLAGVAGSESNEEVPPPPAAGASDFAPAPVELPRLPRIASLTSGPLVDIWEAVPAEDTLLPLSYETPAETPQGDLAKKPIGERPSVPLRPRHRYPYAASEVRTRWPEAEDIFAFTAAEEWGAVAPDESGEPKLEAKLTAESVQIDCEVGVPLGLVALAAQTVAGDDEAPYERDPESMPAKPLGTEVGLHVDTAWGDWAGQPQRPAGASTWQPSYRYPRSAKARPLPAVNFPSLFQLAAVLPPRPEGGAQHG